MWLHAWLFGSYLLNLGSDGQHLLQVLEALFRARWGRLDGLGALIISPTRELALQIFDELRKVGAYHDLSAGLLIGGKDVEEERSRVSGQHTEGKHRQSA